MSRYFNTYKSNLYDFLYPLYNYIRILYIPLNLISLTFWIRSLYQQSKSSTIKQSGDKPEWILVTVLKKE